MRRSACLVLLAAQDAAASFPNRTARPLIFIHLSKSGGTSIDETLGISNVFTPTATAECEGIPIMHKRFLKHDTAQVAKTYYTDAEWAAAYKFSIVRNPWHRIVSWWAHLTTVANTTAPDGANTTDVCLQACSCTGNVSLAALQSASGHNAAASALLPPGTEANSDPSIGDPLYYCSFSHFFEMCLSEVTSVHQRDDGATGWWNDGGGGCQQNPSSVNVTAWIEQLYSLEDGEARAAGAMQLTPANALVDFVGRTENLTSHFEEALVAAGKSGLHTSCVSCHALGWACACNPHSLHPACLSSCLQAILPI